MIHKATPYRFHGEGSDPVWGAQVEDTDAQEGDMILLTTRTGKQFELEIDRIVVTLPTRLLVMTRQISHYDIHGEAVKARQQARASHIKRLAGKLTSGKELDELEQPDVRQAVEAMDAAILYQEGHSIEDIAAAQFEAGIYTIGYDEYGDPIDDRPY